ncbi:Ig-like domain-containing protein [Clostridium gasigenes]|uniref:Ig-like domain (Group 2) n=1 Tax=Clostridium gasigenes TaxID=94869 RepID=A0A1H0TJI9_9CLOT|nr:Ig-like domain-containing protein [Clostridium gasigenes]MBB6624588.1 Ig-like domain-containing protein [Clostridium gasigenes]SDP54193.1 Ig-like domain (group 2) [Clostridium gasigenes]
MKNALKKVATILLIIFATNFMPVQAYNGQGSNESYINGSGFGLSTIENVKDKDGNRTIKIGFIDGIIENIKSLKVYTKVKQYEGNNYQPNNYGPGKEIILDGFSLELTNKEGNKFTGEVKEEYIKEFGEYYFDKIEITYNDNSKKVSFNNKFYDSISDNDKNNGELVSSYAYSEESQHLSANECKFKSKKVKLNEEQVFRFNVATTSAKVEPQKVFITFKNTTNESSKEQIREAEKVDTLKYETKLKLTNSLDTGDWKVSKIEFVDNYGRTYNSLNNFYESFNVVSENTDIDAPKIIKSSITSKIYDAKSETKPNFQFEITDDISGIESGNITIVNKKNIEVTKNFSLNNYSNKDVYTTNLYGLNTNGEYEVSQVALTDKAGNSVTYISDKYYKDYMKNSSYIVADFSKLDVEVINNDKEVEVEKENIQIIEIVNNNKEISNGMDIDMDLKIKSNKIVKNLYVNIKDKRKNVNNTNNVYGQQVGDTTEDGISTYKIRSKDSSLAYLESSEYMIANIHLSYNENNKYNSKIIYDLRYNRPEENAGKYDFSHTDFICKNPNEDLKKPEILDIVMDKKVVLPGDTINFTIKVKDDKSGFEGYASNYLSMDYSNAGIRESLNVSSYNKETNEFKGTITIPKYASTGKYKISNLNIRDVSRKSKYYGWNDEADKELLGKGTILVKKDLNEMLPPEISVKVSKDKVETFKAPFVPSVSADHGTIEMKLNDEVYKSEPINKVGSYHLYITATGVDGSVSTDKVYFKVIAEITNETTPDIIIDQILNSTDKNIEIEVNSDKKEIDSSIFKAIKGTDKTISLTQEDGTVWTFEGKDIKDENIGSINIRVSNVVDEKNKDSIDNIDQGAKIIHFDYHGALPGKATVKVKVDNPEDVRGKDLTFYYYNPETKKPEKVQGPLSIDRDGYVTVQIEHCSDYFLSVDDKLDENTKIPVITVDKTDINLKEGEKLQLNATIDPIIVVPVYSSLDEKVATVSNTGEIRAISFGETQIKITAKDSVAFVKVNVKKIEEIKPELPKAPVITTNKEIIALKEGKEEQLEIIVDPADTKVTISSLNEEIVKVSKVKDLKLEGKTIINIEAKNIGETFVKIDAGTATKTIKVTVVKDAEVSIPKIPVTPELPVIPEVPVKPEVQEIPKIPELPVTLDLPVKLKLPVKSEVLVTPVVPVKLEVQEKPQIPNTGDLVGSKSKIVFAIFLTVAGVMLFIRKKVNN